MELKDTVKGMMSDDYKERMAAEYHQTKIRYEKLKKLNTRMEAKVICTSSAVEPSWMVRPHACCVISSALWGSIDQQKNASHFRVKHSLVHHQWAR